MPLNKLAAAFQALLFVSADPVKLGDLRKAAGCGEEDALAALDFLENSLQGSGLLLVRHGQTYSLATSPETSEIVEKFLNTQARTELSQAALETLAIVAYQQPITKAQIDSVRGVSSEQTLRNLLQRGLIEEGGQADQPGRPVLYVTSYQFLKQMGLSRIEQLPRPDRTNAD